MTWRIDVEPEPLSAIERALIVLAGGDPDDPVEAVEVLETIIDLIENYGNGRRSI